MKIRILFTCLALALVSVPVVRAQAPAPTKEEDTELAKKMHVIGKSFRKLKNQVADPAQNADSLELVAAMLGAAKDSLALTPEKAADVPADQKAKFVDDYKAGVQTLIDKLGKLQDALKAGQNDQAAKLVTDLNSFEGKEHKEFKKQKPQS